MVEIVVRVRIPKELEDLKDTIERTVDKEVKGIIKRFEALRKAKGCLKTDKNWEELKAEMYDGIYEDLSR